LIFCSNFLTSPNAVIPIDLKSSGVNVTRTDPSIALVENKEL